MKHAGKNYPMLKIPQPLLVYRFSNVSYNMRGHREGGPTGFSKKSKTPFFRDIEKSFQEVTPIGPEPQPFF